MQNIQTLGAITVATDHFELDKETAKNITYNW
jgi:hypothetical protein